MLKATFTESFILVSPFEQFYDFLSLIPRTICKYPCVNIRLWLGVCANPATVECVTAYHAVCKGRPRASSRVLLRKDRRLLSGQ